MISLKGRSFLKLLDFTPEEIEEIYNQMQECKWQFMLPEEREQFLKTYLIVD